MSQLQYIRRTYNVPAYRGRRVRYTGDKQPIEGRIVCARGPYIGVMFDGEKRMKSLHPTWEVEYLPEQSAQLDDETEDEEIDDATRYALGAM